MALFLLLTKGIFGANIAKDSSPLTGGSVKVTKEDVVFAKRALLKKMFFARKRADCLKKKVAEHRRNRNAKKYLVAKQTLAKTMNRIEYCRIVVPTMQWQLNEWKNHKRRQR